MTKQEVFVNVGGELYKAIDNPTVWTIYCPRCGSATTTLLKEGSGVLWLSIGLDFITLCEKCEVLWWNERNYVIHNLEKWHYKVVKKDKNQKTL